MTPQILARVAAHSYAPLMLIDSSWVTFASALMSLQVRLAWRRGACSLLLRQTQKDQSLRFSDEAMMLVFISCFAQKANEV